MDSEQQGTTTPIDNSGDDEAWSTASEDLESDKDDMEFLSGMLKTFNPFASSGSKRYLYLQQGVGGIYTLPMEAKCPATEMMHRTTAVCTTGLMTCVGVYVPIDDTRCFAAHFDGSVLLPGDRDIRTWQLPLDLVSSFKDIIRSSLDQSFAGMQEELEKIRASEDLKDSVVVVCPWQVVGGQKATGFYIIEVLCEYFQLSRAKLATKFGAQHGFIVNHRTKEVQLVGWTRPGPTERDFDEIAWIANNCSKPTWGENFRSVFRATWEYVFPDALGWEMLLPGGKDGRGGDSWLFEFDGDKGVWTRGCKT